MSTQQRQDRLNLYLQERNRAEELLQLGQKNEAIALLERAKDEAQKNEDEDFRILFDAMQMQIVDPMQFQVEILNQALQWEEMHGYPMEQSIYLAIGRYYADNDDPETASAWFGEAYNINEQDLTTLRLIGVSFLKQGDPQTAIEWFKSALSLSDKKDSFSWKERALAHQSIGESDMALKCMQNAFKLRPDLWKTEYEKLKKFYEKKANPAPQRPPNVPKLSPTLMQEFTDDLSDSQEDEYSRENEYSQKSVESPTDTEKNKTETDKKSVKDEKDAFNHADSPSIVNSGFVSETNVPPSDVATSDVPPFDIATESKTLEHDENDDEISIGAGPVNQEASVPQSQSEPTSQKNQTQETPAIVQDNAVNNTKDKGQTQPNDNFLTKSESGEMVSNSQETLPQKVLRRKREASRTVFQQFFQKSRLPKDKALWFFLRTPNFQPLCSEVNVGGGHFLWNRGSGTIIDPGFGFLEQFLKIGGSLAEVQNVVITQDHESHLAQFEMIRQLLLQGGLAANVRFYVNLGAMQRLSAVLDMNDKSFSQGCLTLYAGADYELIGGGKLNVLPAYRQEIKSVDHAVGLKITLPQSEAGQESKKIVYTSDTGLFPLTLSYDSTENRIVHISDKNQVHRILSRRYLDEGAANADLMVLHIGSLNVQFDKSSQTNAEKNPKINEMDHTDLANRPTESQLLDLCSVGELGYLGTREILSSCTPKFAAVCGWTQDMIPLRTDLCNFLQEQCNEIHSKIHNENPNGQSAAKIVPEDFSLVYDIYADAVFDCVEYGWIPARSTMFASSDATPNETSGNLYFFAEEKSREFESVSNYYVQRFFNDLKYKKNLYFTSND